MRNRFDDDIGRAATGLIRAGSKANREGLSTERITDITAQLPVYTGLVEHARAVASLGGEDVEYLQRASSLMQATILRRAESLERGESERLDERYEGAVAFPARVPILVAATDPGVQRHLAQHHSRAPARRSVYDDLAGDPVMQLLERVLREARPRPSSPQWSAISDEIQQQVFPAYTGGRDPGAAIDSIRAFLARTLADS